MQNVLKIGAGAILTIILTVFTLGVINGSGTKQYTVEDIPGVGWTVKVTKAAGRSLGEKMRKTEPSQN